MSGHLTSLPIVDEGAPEALGGLLGGAGPMLPRPDVRLPEGATHSAEVAAVLGAALEGLRAAAAGGGGSVFSLAGLGTSALRLLDETLGTGEVSIAVRDPSAPGSHSYRIDETLLPGLWRVRTANSSGAQVGDHLEAAAAPSVLLAASQEGTSGELPIGEPPPGVMNAMPLLSELRHRMQAPQDGSANHVISFTQLPMSDADMAFVQERLGHGPIEAESRGYGRCRVELTSRRNIWSVQFLNAMGTVILDTLEVGGPPEVLLAAREDFEDSAERLSELLAEQAR
jgi:hydrogenase-1 operon protein HyaF